MRDGGGFCCSFCGRFDLKEIFGVCKKPALIFVVQLEVTLSRAFFTVGTAFVKTCPPNFFIFPHNTLCGNHGKKVKFEMVFTLGKADNLRLNYPALNQTLKEIILMLLEVDPRT
jgi:hypothetical protein